MKTLRLGHYNLDDDEIVVTIDDVKAAYPQSVNFLHHLNRQCVVTQETNDSDKPRFRVRLFTDSYTYSISISENYCGCIMHCRKCNPMEDWNRGGDLPDGKNIEETYNRIAQAIMENELIVLGDVVDIRSEEDRNLCAEECGEEGIEVIEENESK